jgi:uncharacterized protein YbjT (DUF2867 family)
MSKTAILAGASGLVGSKLLIQLLSDPYYHSVKIIVRKTMDFQHPKLKQIIVDFDKLEKYSDQISGDIAFCTLGTTIKAAGSKEAFAKVDYTYVLNFADIVKRNGASRFLLVSSLGVSETGGNFYLTIKRDVENSLKKMNFRSLVIVRPSMLLGERKEFRLAESIGKTIMKVLGFLFVGKLKKYKAIDSDVVARALISLSKTDLEGTSVFESDRLQELGKI